MPSPQNTAAAAPVPDRRIVRLLWPVLLAAVISLFPFTVYATFLVPIAEAAGTDEALAGTLRGLGGLAALATGVALAPLIARWTEPRTTAVSLALLAATSLVGTLGTFPALIVFCAGTGAATALLLPALLATATAAFPAKADAGRAATLVTATGSLAAVLAGPVIGAIGWWLGWRGALWTTAAVAALIAALFLRPGARTERSPARAAAPGYLAAFRALRRRPDLLALIAMASLRTTAFMGALAFLAAHYHQRFGLDAVTFTYVWTLSGAAFFTGNYLAGRWSRTTDARRRILLLAALGAAAVAVTAVFTAPLLPQALAATALLGFSHAVIAAQITTLIAHRGGELTTTAFSVNAAGMSLGVFGGALLGGLGSALAGPGGLALALAAPTLLAVLLAGPATRPAPAGGAEPPSAAPGAGALAAGRRP